MKPRLSVFAALIAVSLVLLGCSSGSGDSAQARAAKALEEGLAAHAAGDIGKAEERYKETLKLDPLNKFAYYDLGVIYQSRGDAVLAENNYRLAISVDPTFALPFYNLGILKRDQGDLVAAVDLFRRTIALDPGNAAAHQNLGLVLRKLGREEEALVELRLGGQPVPGVTPAP